MDDIVTRLKNSEHVGSHGKTQLNIAQLLLNRAAVKEIERLRAELEFWRTTAQTAMDNTDKALAVIELHKALKTELEKAVSND